MSFYIVFLTVPNNQRRKLDYLQMKNLLLLKKQYDVQNDIIPYIYSASGHKTVLLSLGTGRKRFGGSTLEQSS